MLAFLVYIGTSVVVNTPLNIQNIVLFVHFTLPPVDDWDLLAWCFALTGS